MTVRELRAEIRGWRRGRARLRWSEVVSEAYTALLTAAVLGSMTISVILNVRHLTIHRCPDVGCAASRNLLPWLAGAAALVIVLAISRLFGPLFVTPAVASWLLPTPADRAALLRPRLLVTGLVAITASGSVASVAATLGGFPLSTVVWFATLAGLLGGAALWLAALAQITDSARATRVVTGTAAGIGVLVWLGLLALALHRGPGDPPPATGWTGWLAVIAVAAGLLGLLHRCRRALAGTPRHVLTPGGRLAPGLSGALATLDLALAYDIVLARLWQDRAAVRSRRGGPGGPAALVWRDVLRLVRNPWPLILLGGSVVVPYVAVAAGGGVVVVPVAALAGFLTVLGLCTGLRVVTRSPGMARLMGFSPARTRLACLAVPIVGALGFGMAVVPALSTSGPAFGSVAILLGAAISMSAVAAATRWITGRPPDYDRPLVSSPAGAIPTNLYGSALRGFDIWFLTSAPMLLLAGSAGAVVSLALSIGVLGYLVARR